MTYSNIFRKIKTKGQKTRSFCVVLSIDLFQPVFATCFCHDLTLSYEIQAHLTMLRTDFFLFNCDFHNSCWNVNLHHRTGCALPGKILGWCLITGSNVAIFVYWIHTSEIKKRKCTIIFRKGKCASFYDKDVIAF